MCHSGWRQKADALNDTGSCWIDPRDQAHYYRRQMIRQES